MGARANGCYYQRAIDHYFLSDIYETYLSQVEGAGEQRERALAIGEGEARDEGGDDRSGAGEAENVSR